MQLYVLCLFIGGVVLQGAYALWSRTLPFAVACAGALCVALAALADRDILLLLGQCMVLGLVFIAKKPADKP